MKRFVKVIVIYFLLYPFLIIHATEVDVLSKGNIMVHYQYESKTISSVKMQLYKISDINSNYEYLYLERYQSLKKDISNMSSSDVGDYAITLKKYIESNRIFFDDAVFSNSQGIGTFNNLDVGLYLLLFDEKEEDGERYNASPILVVVPSYQEKNNSYIYSVNIYPKVEVTTIISNSDSEKSNSVDNNSKTNDVGKASSKRNNGVKNATDDASNEDNNTTVDTKSDSNKTVGSIKSDDNKENTVNNGVSIQEKSNSIIVYVIVLSILVLGTVIVVLYKKGRKKEFKDEKTI